MELSSFSQNSTKSWSQFRDARQLRQLPLIASDLLSGKSASICCHIQSDFMYMCKVLSPLLGCVGYTRLSTYTSLSVTFCYKLLAL